MKEFSLCLIFPEDVLIRFTDGSLSFFLSFKIIEMSDPYNCENMQAMCTDRRLVL